LSGRGGKGTLKKWNHETYEMGTKSRRDGWACGAGAECSGGIWRAVWALWRDTMPRDAWAAWGTVRRCAGCQTRRRVVCALARTALQRGRMKFSKSKCGGVGHHEWQKRPTLNPDASGFKGERGTRQLRPSAPDPHPERRLLPHQFQAPGFRPELLHASNFHLLFGVAPHAYDPRHIVGEHRRRPLEHDDLD